jgi:hypothetical protein
MEFIKNNQCLKIRVSYDQDGGCIAFKDFFDGSGLESINDHAYAYFPNTPRWTEEELNGMTEDERQEWQEIFDWDWTRYTLANVSWKEWYDVAQEEDVIPYRYTATGHSQSEWAYLYLFGMEEAEAEKLVNNFESYAYDTPYYYEISLIDCEDGRTIADDSCGGIYDDTCDLDYLKHELSLAIKCLGRIDEELKALALEEVQALDYTRIDN